MANLGTKVDCVISIMFTTNSAVHIFFSLFNGLLWLSQVIACIWFIYQYDIMKKSSKNQRNNCVFESMMKFVCIATVIYSLSYYIMVSASTPLNDRMSLDMEYLESVYPACVQISPWFDFISQFYYTFVTIAETAYMVVLSVYFYRIILLLKGSIFAISKYQARIFYFTCIIVGIAIIIRAVNAIVPFYNELDEFNYVSAAFFIVYLCQSIYLCLLLKRQLTLMIQTTNAQMVIRMDSGSAIDHSITVTVTATATGSVRDSENSSNNNGNININDRESRRVESEVNKTTVIHGLMKRLTIVAVFSITVTFLNFTLIIYSVFFAPPGTFDDTSNYILDTLSILDGLNNILCIALQFPFSDWIYYRVCAKCESIKWLNVKPKPNSSPTTQTTQTTQTIATTAINATTTTTTPKKKELNTQEMTNYFD